MTIKVKQDGTGDFCKLQHAVDSAREGDEILIFPGVYEGRVIVNKNGITLHGTDSASCVITGSRCAKDPGPDGKEKGTFLSYTLLVTGDDVTVRDLTVRNTAGPGRQAGQAVAVYAAGDRDSWYNVFMLGHQDTLFTGPTMPKVQKDALPWDVPEGVPSVGDCPKVSSRQYFENCFIRGDVDFIFGPYACWFENCLLYMNSGGGWYTAANTPEDNEYGFVFSSCRLTGEGTGRLGRPWRKYARTAFLNCRMDACVDPRGFTDWDTERVVTGRLCEYACTGPGADRANRHPSEAQLTDEEAKHYSLEKVLNGWQPCTKRDRIPDQEG